MHTLLWQCILAALKLCIALPVAISHNLLITSYIINFPLFQARRDIDYFLGSHRRKRRIFLIFNVLQTLLFTQKNNIMRKLFTLLIFTLFWAGSSWGASVTIGTGTSTGRYPLNDYFAHSSSQSLYLASEIGASGTITNIRWYRNDVGANSNAIGTTEIWLMETPNSVLTGTTWEGPGTLVATISNIDLGAGGGWLDIPINSFVYNGTDNLLVSVRTQNAPYTPPHSYWRYTSTSTAYLMRAGNSDTQNPPTLYLSYSRPNIQLEMIVVVNDPPNCTSLLSPADNATNVLSTATLNWAEAGGFPTGYKLYFGTDNPPTNLVNGTDLGNVTTYDPTPDLSYNTPYYWKVVPYNANGDATGCATWSFTTMADPTITTFPYSQGFEDVTFPPLGWSVIDNNADGDKWILSTTNPRTGLRCARIYTDYNTTNDDYLVTPPIVLSANQELKFWVRANSTTETETEEISILMSTTTPTPGAFTTVLLPSTPVVTTSYVEYTINLSAYTGTVYISFTRKDTPADGWYLHLDDVLIRDIPSAPVFAITPPSKDFGTVGVGESLSQVFTISNTGAGTLIIDPAISISGTNADQFILTDGNTYPLSLTVGQSATVSVAFMPTSEGVKNANLIIVDNLGAKTSNSVPLTGTGFERPAGSTCGNPYEVTSLPFNYTGTTEGYGDDYDRTWVAPASYYITGDDMVFEFTLAAPSYLSGSISTTLTYPGLIITQDCPDLLAPAAVLASATASGSSASFSDVLLPAGTYFAIVSSWTTPQSIDFTLNLSAVEAQFGTLRGEITDCYSNALLEGVSVTAGSLSTTTDIDGYYEFQDVPVGTYDIVTSLSGYVNKTTSGVEVLNGQITNQNICMNVYLDPPLNLQASVTSQDVQLTWNAPGDLPDTEELIYDNDIVTGAYSYEGATMAIHMSPQGPCKILTLKYYTTTQLGDNTFNAEVYNWDEIANTPGTTLLYEVGATAVDENWMDIDISSQNITVSGDFVVGFGSINATTFLGYDTNLDNGRIWDYDGTAWTEWIEAYLIRAVVEYSDGSRQLLSATPSSSSKYAPITNLMSKHEIISGEISANMKLTPTNIAGVQIEKSIKRNAITPINNKANRSANSNNQSLENTDNGRATLSTLTGYNVYRDGDEIIHNINPLPLLYNDLNLPAGIYSYTVTAQYLEGESSPAGPVLAEVITCQAPIDLTVNVTTNSAVLSWTPQGSATTWDVEWGEIGFIPGAGTMLNVNNPTTTITGLTSGGQYEFYVRSYCSSTDQSYWIGPKTFRTHFFECPVGSTAELETCGDDTNGGCNMDVPVFGSISLGETICGTSWHSTTSRDTDWFEFTLTATTVVTITGTGDFDIVVGFIASPCPVTEFIDYGSALAGGTASVTTQLDAGTYYAFVAPQFTGIFACGEGDRYQVTLTGTTCLDIPTALGAANITQTSADLSWTSAGSLWNIEYGVTGFTQGNGTLVSGLTSPAYSPNDLVGSQSYTYYVQTDCGTDVGAWSAPYTFSTACDPIGLPWVENFDAVTAPAIPICMSVTDDNDDAVKWVTSTSSPLSAPNAMRISYNSTLAMDDWFFSPGLNLVPGTYNVSFFYRSSGASFPEALEVKWGTAPNAAGMTSAAIFDNGNIVNSIFAEGTGTIAISTAGVYYVGWHGYSDADQFYLMVDDISITEAPATKTLNLTGIMLEGLYDGSGTMRQAFNETGPQFGAGIADEITVELHAAADYGTTVHTVNNVMLSTSGMATIDDLPGTFDGDYYITIRHRNSIETTSATAVSFAGSIINQSYAAPADVYGANLVQMIDGYYAIYGGDVNQDGQVEGLDAGDIENGVNLFLRGYLTIDVDGSGGLDTNDFTIWENNNNNFVKRIIPVP